MGKKKEYRCTPTFVNLKSNTMKNTVAKVRLFSISANFLCYLACFITFIKGFGGSFYIRYEMLGGYLIFSLKNYV